MPVSTKKSIFQKWSERRDEKIEFERQKELARQQFEFEQGKGTAAVEAETQKTKTLLTGIAVIAGIVGAVIFVLPKIFKK